MFFEFLGTLQKKVDIVRSIARIGDYFIQIFSSRTKFTMSANSNLDNCPICNITPVNFRSTPRVKFKNTGKQADVQFVYTVSQKFVHQLSTFQNKYISENYNSKTRMSSFHFSHNL